MRANDLRVPTRRCGADTQALQSTSHPQNPTQVILQTLGCPVGPSYVECRRNCLGAIGCFCPD